MIINCEYCGKNIDTTVNKKCPYCGATYGDNQIIQRQEENEQLKKELQIKEKELKYNKQKQIHRRNNTQIKYDNATLKFEKIISLFTKLLIIGIIVFAIFIGVCIFF